MTADVPPVPSDILAGIRGCGYRNGATGAECARLSDAAAVDVPLLVAAVEAALKQHPPIRADGGNSDELLCDKCSFAYRTPWPCGEVAAITAALTGAGNEGSEDE